jgi:hypothetical protein
MQRKLLVILLVGCLLVMQDIHAQNVGIGTTNPLEKLEVSGAIRLSNTTGSNAGTIRFNTANNDFEGFDGTYWHSLTLPRYYASVLTTNFTATATATSAPVGGAILTSPTFIPVSDRVLVTFSASGQVSAASGIAVTPGHPFGFRIVRNQGGPTPIKQFWTAFNRNSAAIGDQTGRLTISFTYPVDVTPGVPASIEVHILSFFTTAGSVTFSINPTILSNSASLVVTDAKVN